MSKASDLAVGAIQDIYRMWQVDPTRMQWTGSTTPEGLLREGYRFDWWPGNFNVQVRLFGPHSEVESPVFRLSVRTSYLAHANVNSPNFLNSLHLLGRFTPSFAFCVVPTELARAHGLGAEASDVSLVSTAYLHEGVIGWMPRFFAGLAILQPIEAQFRAEPNRALLGGEPDRSTPPAGTAVDTLDEMLSVEREIYQPAGRAPSRWHGTGEFEAIIEKWGRRDTGFGFGDAAGLTIETPFGADSAMLQLLTNQPHPRLGNGLLAVLKLPFTTNADEADAVSNQLNFVEATTWTKMRMPLLGAWSTSPRGEDGSAGPAFCTFLPNLVYQPGIAENLVLWSLARARWVRETLRPDLVDLPMHEILQRRYSLQGQ